MRRSGSSASAGQRVDVRRPPGELVVLVVGGDGRAVGAARPARRAAPRSLGSRQQRLDPSAARGRPTTPRAARGRACRPGSRRPRPSRRRRAPSGPAHDASQPARRPASQRPSAAPHDAQHRQALAPRPRDQAQRPARGLELERQAVVRRPRSRRAAPARPSWLGEPRSRSASSASSAASIAFAGRARTAPRARRPRPGRDPRVHGRADARRAGRHALHGTVGRRTVGSAGRVRGREAAQALGMGLRGRAALAGRAARRRGVPARAARLRLARARDSRCRSRSCAAGPRLQPPEALEPICSDRRLRAGAAQPTAAPTATSCARSAAASSTRPTSSRARATRTRSQAALDWALSAGAAVIPFGGGTSVVGGVEPRRRRAATPGS